MTEPPEDVRAAWARKLSWDAWADVPSEARTFLLALWGKRGEWVTTRQVADLVGRRERVAWSTYQSLGRLADVDVVETRLVPGAGRGGQNRAWRLKDVQS